MTLACAFCSLYSVHLLRLTASRRAYEQCAPPKIKKNVFFVFRGFRYLNKEFPVSPFWGHPGCEVPHLRVLVFTAPGGLQQRSCLNLVPKGLQGAERRPNKSEKLKLSDLEKDIDFAGFQRQFRILGTLSRLHLRDKKSFRLKDLKQTLRFLQVDLAKYASLKELANFLTEKVEPKLIKTLRNIQ